MFSAVNTLILRTNEYIYRIQSTSLKLRWSLDWKNWGFFVYIVKMKRQKILCLWMQGTEKQRSTIEFSRGGVRLRILTSMRKKPDVKSLNPYSTNVPKRTLSVHLCDERILCYVHFYFCTREEPHFPTPEWEIEILCHGISVHFFSISNQRIVLPKARKVSSQENEVTFL